MVSLAGPAAVWKKAGKAFGGIKGAIGELDTLFMGYHAYYFPDFEMPPAGDWGKPWLKFAVEHRLEAMIAYLFEVDPPQVARGLLKGKKIRKLSLAALCLAAAPGKAKAIKPMLDLTQEYYWRDERAKLRKLLEAIEGKKGAEAKLLAAELAGCFYDDGVGQLLTDSLRKHFS